MTSADHNQYYGLKNRDGGYDGVILQEFKADGLTLFYMSATGWVENNDLILDLHDTDTTPINAETARTIAETRFQQQLER
jgi:hypothetical protein